MERRNFLKWLGFVPASVGLYTLPIEAKEPTIEPPKNVTIKPSQLQPVAPEMTLKDITLNYQVSYATASTAMFFPRFAICDEIRKA